MQTAYGRIKIGKSCYTYVVKASGNDRVYKRVGSAPCKTNENHDQRLFSLLTGNAAIMQAFIAGVDIVIRRR